MVHDAWTGDIRTFSIIAEKTGSVLFYSPEDVSESSSSLVKLKSTFKDVGASIQYGARVYDKNDRFLGIVDYPVTDTLTGEVKEFKVRTESPGKPLFNLKPDAPTER